MKIIIDTREQRPYSFTAWPDAEVMQGSLSTGDYSLAGLTDRVALERKSLDDLAGTLTNGRERFAAECQRGRGLDLFGLVIEGSLDDILGHRYKSRVAPQSLIQTLAAWSVRYRFAVWFAGNRQGGELMVYSILQKYLRDAVGRLDALVKAHGHDESGRDIERDHGPKKTAKNGD
jgi:ERCC4-type nuclease